MTRSAMTALAAALLLGAAGLLGACAGPKSTALVHAEKVEGLPICTSCHDADRAAANHDARWMKSHGAVACATSAPASCATRSSSCADCHAGNQEEIKPSDKPPAASTRPRRTAATGSRSTGSKAASTRPPASPATGARTWGGAAHVTSKPEPRGPSRSAARFWRCSRPAARRRTGPRSIRTRAPGRLLRDAPRRVSAARTAARAECHGGDLLGGISTVSCSRRFPRRPVLSRGRPRGASGRLARVAHGDGSASAATAPPLPR